MMKKRVMVVALAVGAGAAGACAGPALDITGDAMVQLGDALSDVGHLGMGDAAAEPAEYVVDCVREVRGETSTIYADGRGNRVVTAFWTATLREPSIDPARIVSAGAVVCGRVAESEVFPTPTASCPDGATCVTDSTTLPELDCQAFGGVSVERGLARVYCGLEQERETLDAGGVRRTYTRTVSRGTTARFLIDQR